MNRTESTEGLREEFVELVDFSWAFDERQYVALEDV